jgi:hypothetical protein
VVARSQIGSALTAGKGSNFSSFTFFAALRQQSYVAAVRQYLQLLTGEALMEGVALDAADIPLVQ